MVCPSGNFTVQFTTGKSYKGHTNTEISTGGKFQHFCGVSIHPRWEKNSLDTVPRNWLQVSLLEQWGLDQITSRGPFNLNPSVILWSEVSSDLIPMQSQVRNLSTHTSLSHPHRHCWKNRCCESRTHPAGTGSSRLLEESLIFSARKHEVMQLFGNLHLIHRLNKSKNLNYLINKFWRQFLSLRKTELTFHIEA